MSIEQRNKPQTEVRNQEKEMRYPNNSNQKITPIKVLSQRILVSTKEKYNDTESIYELDSSKVRK